MKLHKIILAFSLVLFASCEEFQPVFTGKYKDPVYQEPVEMEANTTIAELKDDYVANNNQPIEIQANVIIKGQVTTSDQPGNLYKSFYIQDETAGIEVKVGRNGLYNEYKLGQWIYVDCNGLTVGDYNGMIQLGFDDPTKEYETSYIEHPYIIDQHVFKGPFDEPVKPKEISSSELNLKENMGRLVTIKNLTYGKEIFCLAYVNPNLKGEAKKASNNRIFLSDGKTWGVTTWAMSKNLFAQKLQEGVFDTATTNDAVELPDGTKTNKVGEFKQVIIPAAYAVSQYFKMDGVDVQVRTSGYARFADTEIDPEVLSGAKKIDFTGILTNYKGAAQFTLISLDDINVHE